MQVISNGPVHVLIGSAQDQAVQLGRATRSDILANVEIVRQEREKVLDTGMAADRYDDALRCNEDFIRSVSPETLNEIATIADGSGIPYRDLLDLNLMTYFPLRRLHSECSQIYVGPARTRGSGRILAKSRDMGIPSLLQSTIVRNYPDGTQIAEVIHSGAITSPGAGMNNHGLTLSTSGVWARSASYRMSDAGKGWNLIDPHLLLQAAKTVSDVERLLNETSRNCGLNIIAADMDAAATLEVTPDRVVRTDDADGRLVLTNHYTSPALETQSPKPEEYRSTFDRAEFLMGFNDDEKFTSDTVWAAMTDHSGYPQSSICRHPTDQIAEPSITACASVAVLPEQVFMVAMGQPCAARLTFTGNGPESPRPRQELST